MWIVKTNNFLLSQENDLETRRRVVIARIYRYILSSEWSNDNDQKNKSARGAGSINEWRKAGVCNTAKDILTHEPAEGVEIREIKLLPAST
jgi:hypothetical protein